MYPLINLSFMVVLINLDKLISGCILKSHCVDIMTAFFYTVPVYPDIKTPIVSVVSLQCCGSVMFIADPVFSIPDSGSNNSNKRGGGIKNLLFYQFL
jgi:hypothetical protein